MNKVFLSLEHSFYDLLMKIGDNPDTSAPVSELIFLERIQGGVLLNDKALGWTSVVADIPQYKTGVSKIEVGQSSN